MCDAGAAAAKGFYGFWVIKEFEFHDSHTREIERTDRKNYPPKRTKQESEREESLFIASDFKHQSLPILSLKFFL